MSEPLGELINSLGVEHTPDPGELVSDAIVLLKVVSTDGDVSLRMAFSDGMSWIDRLGMLRAAETVECNDLLIGGD